jgi:hypothetical protein
MNAQQQPIELSARPRVQNKIWRTRYERISISLSGSINLRQRNRRRRTLLQSDEAQRTERNHQLLLGNDTSGANDSFSLSLCNGPLKRSTEYKCRLAVLLSFIGLRMLVGGCPLQGCRYAISKGFQTSGPGGGGRSLGWNVSFSADSLVHLDQVRRSSLRSRSSLDRNLFLCSLTKRDVERRVLMNCRN